MSDRSSLSAPAWQPWQMSVLERRSAGRGAAEPAGTPARRREDEISIQLFELAKEEAVQKGYEEGRAEGLKQGYAEGEAKARAEHQDALDAELRATISPIQTMVAAFHQAADDLNEQVSYALVELALETGRQLAGRALELKPEHILDDIEDLLAENATVSGSPTLYVNIDDLAVVEIHLTQTLAASGWSLRPDMSLARGDCRIETEQREIDASVSDRWSRLLHAVGHGEH